MLLLYSFQRNSPTQETYTSLELEEAPLNLYHALDSPSEENKPPGTNLNSTISTQLPPAQGNRDPLYFETEPIYSDAITPYNKRRYEPLYHEMVPETLNNNERKSSIFLPSSLGRRPSDSPPPVPTSRRPSSAILNLPLQHQGSLQSSV